jgi:hypothetical protein
MFVADAGIAVWVFGFLLLGVLGFFVMAAALLIRFIGWVFRAAIGGSGAGREARAAQPSAPRHGVCPHPGCGHVNGPTALYCGRCGRPLRRTYDVGAYG